MSDLPLIEEKKNLASYSSWLVGGVADYFSQPETLDQLKSLILWCEKKNMPQSILGGGTNVLISDKGIRGLTICMRKLRQLEVVAEQPRLKLEALAGTPKAQLLKVFLKYKLEPAIFLAGLPGDVGGGVAMNAGVGEALQPREFVEIVDWVEVLRDQKVIRLAKNELQWSYRHCRGWEPGVIFRVGFSWPNEPKDQIIEVVKRANKERLHKQPLDLPSCGSVFVNPEGHKSGALIAACGLKGFRVGAAQVSEKHANFIVNLGHARASDIHQLIQHVQSTLLSKKQIQLRTEVVYLGDWS